MRIILIHQGDVIKFVVLLFQHPTHTVVEDDRHFIGKGWVVGAAIWDGGGYYVAGSVLVL